MKKEKAQSGPSLQALSVATRLRSQALLRNKTVFQGLAAMFAISSLFLVQPYSAYAATLGLIIQLSAMYLGYQAREIHELSREAQRRVLLTDAMGVSVDVYDEIELRREISKYISVGLERFEPKRAYYSSVRSSGSDRMRENLQESVFYTRELLESDRRHLVVYAAVATACLLVIAYIAFIAETTMSREIIALALLTASLAVIETWISALAAQRSCQLLRNLDRRLCLGEASNYPNLLAAFADYAVATATAPPVSTRKYEIMREELNDLWMKRLSSPE